MASVASVAEDVLWEAVHDLQAGLSEAVADLIQAHLEATDVQVPEAVHLPIQVIDHPVVIEEIMVMATEVARDITDEAVSLTEEPL